MIAQETAEMFLSDHTADHAGIDQQTSGQGDQWDDVKDDALMIAKEGAGGLDGGVEGDGVGGEEEGLRGHKPVEALDDEAVFKFDLGPQEAVVVGLRQRRV